jgi:hypothetical protein
LKYSKIKLETAVLDINGRRHFSAKHSEEWKFISGKKAFIGMKNKEGEEKK